MSNQPTKFEYLSIPNTKFCPKEIWYRQVSLYIQFLNGNVEICICHMVAHFVGKPYMRLF